MARSEGFCSLTDPAAFLHSGQGDRRTAVETFSRRRPQVLGLICTFGIGTALKTNGKHLCLQQSEAIKARI